MCPPYSLFVWPHAANPPDEYTLKRGCTAQGRPQVEELHEVAATLRQCLIPRPARDVLHAAVLGPSTGVGILAEHHLAGELLSGS
jgi:hypothetical protein